MRSSIQIPITSSNLDHKAAALKLLGRSAEDNAAFAKAKELA